MDVRELAPALLGVGNLLRDTNQILNKDLTTVRVLVDSEHKRGCFNIALELWQTYQGVKGLLGEDGIKTAKDILEWLDLAKTFLLPGAALGVLGYYRWRAGRKVTPSQLISDTEASGNIQIHIEGDHNAITIPREVFELAHNPRIAKAVTAVMAPLETDGVDEVRTEIDGVPQLEVTKSEATVP